MRVAAANFHDAIVPLGIDEAANFFGRLVDYVGITELIDEFHNCLAIERAAYEGLGSSASSSPYPRTSCMACSLSPSMIKVCICSSASCSLILLMAKPT